MTELRIYAGGGELLATHHDHDRIAAFLAAEGIRFEGWPTDPALPADAGPEAVLTAYRGQVEALTTEYGFRSVDVVALQPDHPDRDTLRRKFLDEHVHADFEVRFFVDGAGLFYFHLGDRVLGLACRKGDFVSVPAGVRHWFDMGPEPDFKCIRFFRIEAGWVADFTGDDIASRFPRFGE